MLPPPSYIQLSSPSQIAPRSGTPRSYDYGAFAHWERAQDLADWKRFPHEESRRRRKACLYGAASPATSNGPAAPRTRKKSACMQPLEGAFILHSGTRRWGRGCKPTYTPDGSRNRSASHGPGSMSQGDRISHRLRQVSARVAVRRRHGGRGSPPNDMIAKAARRRRVLETSIEVSRLSRRMASRWPARTGD